jgi:putative membrane protein
MIKYNPKLWVRHIFHIAKSDTLQILWKEMLLLGIVTTAITYVEINYFDDIHFLSEITGVYSLVGFVLSLLLVFRTNTAYDRWWEGRKKWGEMVNHSRNLAAKVDSKISNPLSREKFRRWIVNYPFVLKEHLRDGVIKEELTGDAQEIDKIVGASHPPTQLTAMMYGELKELKKQGELSEEEYLVFNQNMNALLDITGACERIKNTPIPYSYSLFLKKFIFIYVTTLPLAFVPTFGYGTALIAIFVFYVLVSIEVLAEEIEDPFGKDDNDLPTDDLCKKIKANVEDLL